MATAPASEVTALLMRWTDGTREERERLISLVYKDLRALAARALRGERRDHTLQPTALVHEAYRKLLDQRAARWQNRAHFYAVAATLMRRILVDHARRRAAFLRASDGGVVLADFSPGRDVDVIAMDDALEELARFDQRQARLVELRFFGGLSVEATAEAMGLSRATVNREWALARAWLRNRLT